MKVMLDSHAAVEPKPGSNVQMPVLQRQGMAGGCGGDRIESSGLQQCLPQSAGGMERHVPWHVDALGQASQSCRRTTRRRAGGAPAQQGESTAQGRVK